jgi:hypothetical protein
MITNDAIIYDYKKFFYLKQLLNSYLDANPKLKTTQKEVDKLMKSIKDYQGKLLTFQGLMMRTNDPILITLLGMNMDILRISKPPLRDIS